MLERIETDRCKNRAWFEQETLQVCFTIPGAPRGKGRPCFDSIHGIVYTPKATRDYEEEVKTEYLRQVTRFQFNEDIPLRIEIVSFYGIPKNTSKKKRAEMLEGKLRPTKKPDADNIIKIICDALNGIAYADDRQIVECFITKYYAETQETKVTIKEIKFASQTR